MKKKLLVEELVIDDTFINYCLHKNDDDFNYWQVFQQVNPEESGTIAEAKELVLALIDATIQNKQTAQSNLNEAKNGWFVLKRFLPYAAMIAGILLVSYFVYLGYFRNNQDLTTTNNQVKGKISFHTPNREMKTIILKDGSKVILDAGSQLTVADDFGNKTRDVYLDGEAVFDVTHNERLPFIVHTSFYNVKVLGTLFNVIAYKNEKRSETSLLRGKVIIILKDNKKISLTPNNKVVFTVYENKVTGAEKNNEVSADSVITVKPISIKKADSSVIETAWTQGRLEINNETFEQFKGRLERWYDVKITLADEEVASYNFTATFEGETIEKVLQALQYSYHFNYKINGKNITISK